MRLGGRRGFCWYLEMLNIRALLTAPYLSRGKYALYRVSESGWLYRSQYRRLAGLEAGCHVVLSCAVLRGLRA